MGNKRSKEKILSWIIVCVLSIMSANAITCEYDSRPSIDQNIMLSCDTIQANTYCYATINKGFGAEQVFPKPESIPSYGLVDYYETKNNQLTMRFDTTKFVPDTNYTVNIYCADIDGMAERTSFTILPVKTRGTMVAYVLQFISSNWLSIIIILIGILIFLMFWRKE